MCIRDRYRDGSKPTQVLEVLSKKTSPTTEKETNNGLIPRVRLHLLHVVTERLRTGHGNMYITINFDEEEKPFEVFSTLGKAGGCESASLEAISRLTSLALRSGVEPKEIVAHLRGITCVPAWDQGVLIGSPADAVALALERHVTGSPRSSKTLTLLAKSLPTTAATEEYTVTSLSSNGTNGTNGKSSNGSGLMCPECNTNLIFQEGCLACLSCGWNKCE